MLQIHKSRQEYLREYQRKRYESMTTEQKLERVRKNQESRAIRNAAMTAEQKSHRNKLNRESARKRFADNPERERANRRRYHLKAKYEITPEKYSELFQDQGSCCAVCKTKEPGSKIGWHTDHCHSTGKVRGILCHHCNVLLGHAGDNEQVLIDAASYILRHREEANSADGNR